MARLKIARDWAESVQHPVESMSVFVTPDMASKWRSKYHYGGQRTFRQWHCDNLAKMMIDGIFRRKTQIAFVEVDGNFYLTNGQHTLAAIELSGRTQELSVVVTHGESMEEVADDFSRHDTHLTRAFGDSLVAHGIHDWLGITATTLHCVTAAVAYYSYLIGDIGIRYTQLTHDQKLALVRKHGRLAAETVGLFEGSLGRSYLTRRTTVASAMLCAAKKPEAAEQFFRAMALDDGLRQSDPRKTLLEWLRLRTTPGGRYGNISLDTKVAADHEFVKGIAAAWNAWLDGRELKFIRVNFDAATAAFKDVGEYTVRSVRKTSGESAKQPQQ